MIRQAGDLHNARRRESPTITELSHGATGSPAGRVGRTVAGIPPAARVPSVITVAIPYYRNRVFVRRAVASVLAQTDPRWQLVVSDGSGGPDADVRDFVQRLADPRVRYLPSDRRLDMPANWNRCLDAATTDLVALLHDDDELLPGYAAGMLAAAARRPAAALLFCEARVIGPDGRPRFSVPDFVKRFYRPRRGREVVLRGEAGLRAVMRGNFIMCPTVCYRTSRLAGRRFPAGWHQALDLAFTSGVLLDGGSMVGLPDVLYAYRRHAGNATAVQTANLLRFREEVAVFDHVARRARGVGWSGAAAVAAGKGVIQLNLGYCAAADLARGHWAAARRKLRLLWDVFAG